MKKDNLLQKTTGRGSQNSADSRFHSTHTEIDLENYGYIEEDDVALVKTKFFKDSSKSIINTNASPDLNFQYSMNAYRGCEHGCAYCFARPTHEYLGMSAGLDFESKIFVKLEAPKLLREKFSSPSWMGEPIFMSGVTDCYQPCERKFQLTRECLKVCAEFRNPVALITKNSLVTRDIDIFLELARFQAIKVFLSITSLDLQLARDLEPRTSTPQARLEAVKKLSQAGIPTGINIAPVIPGLNDHEIPNILKAAKEAGALFAGYTPVRLPYSVSDIFTQWLEKHRPDRKERVLNAIRSMRGGKLNDPSFGSRMEGHGPKANQLATTFEVFSKRLGFNEQRFKLSSKYFRKSTNQLELDL